MTYRQLMNRLLEATIEQLDTDVTVLVNDEFYHVMGIEENDYTDILDAGHIYMLLDTPDSHYSECSRL